MASDVPSSRTDTHGDAASAPLAQRIPQAHLDPHLRQPVEDPPCGVVLDLAAAERSRHALSAFQRRTGEGRAVAARRIFSELFQEATAGQA